MDFNFCPPAASPKRLIDEGTRYFEALCRILHFPASSKENPFEEKLISTPGNSFHALLTQLPTLSSN